jgi:cytochrome c-type biogenesis protein CcmH
MTLWIILTIMTSAASVLVSASFMRRFDRYGTTDLAGNIAVYRDQLTEIDRDAVVGLIDDQQAQTARLEVQRRILAADRNPQPSLVPLTIGERNFAIVVVVGILVLGSVSLYAFNGSPELPSGPVPQRSVLQPDASPVDRLAAAVGAPIPAAQPPARAPLGSVDEMIDRLAGRLKQNPNDAEGWRMLGWSYFSTERFDQSASAYQKAIELNPASAELFSARAEALVRAADGVVTDEAGSVVAKALALDAREPRARFFAGLAKEQAGDKKSALDAWTTILGEADASEPWYTDLKQRADELARELGDDAMPGLPGPKAAATGGVLGLLKQSEMPARTAPGPTTEDVRNADALAPDARNAMIMGMVDRLASRLEQSPRDAEGWVKLIRSRKMLGDAEAATQALRRALDVFKDAPLEQNRITAAARDLGMSR